MTTHRQDVYTRVTAAIIADLERGVRPWLRPWDAAHATGRITRPLRANGQPYRGINVLMLWAAALDQGFAAPTWMTFRQAKALGAFVTKGARGTPVVHADHITRTETGDDGTATERQIYYMKQYTVFNVEQIEGLPEPFLAAPAPPRPDPVPRIDRADRFFAATGITIRHGGDRAYYAPGPDHVQMPPFVAFRDAESYYGTLAHEIIHSTKHRSRLDRDLGGRRFGDEGYAREELVAEIGAAFLCCDLDLTPEPREDHASYLDHWLRVLREDHRAIFQAAAHAQRACDYLHQIQPSPLEARPTDDEPHESPPGQDTT